MEEMIKIVEIEGVEKDETISISIPKSLYDLALSMSERTFRRLLSLAEKLALLMKLIDERF